MATDAGGESAMDAPDQFFSSAKQRILVLSAGGAMHLSAGFTSQAEQLGWSVLEGASAGMALRQIVLMRPAGVIVVLGAEASVEICAGLIVDLRRYQPQLPLVAVAEHHDDGAEQK